MLAVVLGCLRSDLCLAVLLLISVVVLLFKRRITHHHVFTISSMKEKFSKYEENVCLKSYNRFRVGGFAEYFFQPINLDELINFLKIKPKTQPITVLGFGSNVLIRDGGVRGVVIKLGKGFQSYVVDKDTFEVSVGAGMSQMKLSKVCAKNGIGGLEFFCGIPGSIGGALRMNAGAHGKEVKDCLVSTTVIDPNGQILTFGVKELKYTYRQCRFLPKDHIFVSAIFKGFPQARAEIEFKISQLLFLREESQPVNEKTGGCTFANSEETDLPTWKLIHESGCQNLSIGGAQVSKKHANFLINVNNATGEEIETLGNQIQEIVFQKTNFLLKWEVVRVGERVM